MVKAPGVLVVNPQLPVRSFDEFVKYLKANPGKVTYASAGNGTISHMWAELFKSTTNTFMVHIPYRGAGPALNDLLSRPARCRTSSPRRSARRWTRCSASAASRTSPSTEELAGAPQSAS